MLAAVVDGAVGEAADEFDDELGEAEAEAADETAAVEAVVVAVMAETAAVGVAAGMEAAEIEMAGTVTAEAAVDVPVEVLPADRIEAAAKAGSPNRSAHRPWKHHRPHPRQ